MWTNFCCSLYIFGKWYHNEHPSTLTQVSLTTMQLLSVTVFMDHRICVPHARVQLKTKPISGTS